MARIGDHVAKMTRPTAITQHRPSCPPATSSCKQSTDAPHRCAQQSGDKQSLVLQTCGLQSGGKLQQFCPPQRSHTQPQDVPVQQEPNTDGDRNCKVDQQVLFEECMTYLRQVARPGCEGPSSANRFPDVGLADDRSETESKNINVRPDASWFPRLVTTI